jgi:cell division protein FtsB
LNISLTQIIVVILIIVGLSVIIDFNRKIQAGQKITGEANQMRSEVTALAATKAALATELAYVSSDAYVASWAHNDGRYVQANEVLVVPVPAKNATAVPPTPVRIVQKPPSNFEIWWALFFESGDS